jgi:hypothetical protein
MGQISMIMLLAARAGRRKVGVPWRAGLMVLTGRMVIEPVDAGAAAGGGVATAPLGDASGVANEASEAPGVANEASAAPGVANGASGVMGVSG